MNALTVIDSNEAAYRASTDAATRCKEIVVATAVTIQGRKYVCVEGWQALAVAHGCAAGSRDVERVEGGVRAIGEVRRMSDGVLIATAEGFVGEDEPTWYGGQARGKTLPKRDDYAIRSMAQTRAISRACRSAFAHVIVMMKAGLATTPAEEVPFDGFDNGHSGPAPRTVLDGPHTSKTALRTAVHGIIAKVRAAQSLDEITGIMKDADNKAALDQAKRDWPELIDGEPNIEEDTGLRGALADRKGELAEQQAATPDLYAELLASMRECVSVKSLTNWMARNEVDIDALGPLEHGLFETARDKLQEELLKKEAA